MTQNVVAASWALRPGTSPRHATPRTVSSFSVASDLDRRGIRSFNGSGLWSAGRSTAIFCW